MKFEHVAGHCLFCESRRWRQYDCGPNAKRHHCTHGLATDIREKFGDDRQLYPTIYPIPVGRGILAPPNPGARPAPDVFGITVPISSPMTSPPKLPALPYPTPAPHMEHLRCGNAVVYNLGELAGSFEFEPGSVTVYDMSTYGWSNTLKDPRSWAVVSTATGQGIRDLGVWTAGNAGLSVAKLAYAVNRVLPPEKRIRVSCYSVGEPLPEEVRHVLQSFDAHVAVFRTPTRGKIFPVEEVIRRLNQRLRPQINERRFWDVSDGWDGVGLYMYRLIGRQICTELEPTPKYIVAPVGTGDLFFGLCLGRDDCVKARKIKETDCHLVGAIPAGGESIINNYGDYDIEIPTVEPELGGDNPPAAPKLSTIYTPLLLVMYPRLLRRDRVTLIRVSDEDQRAAAGALLDRQANSGRPASEPSALTAFSALPRLSRWHAQREERPGRRVRTDLAKVPVVVVNSGSGILGNGGEHTLLERFLPTPHMV